MMQVRSVLVAASIALAGCTSQSRLALAPVGAATEPNAPVRIAIGETPSVNGASRLPTLLVTVTNTRDADKPFGPANVVVTADGRPVRVYTTPELVAEIRNEAEFRRYAAQTRAEVQARTIEQDPAPPVGTRSAIEIRANGLHESAAATWAERHAVAQLSDMLAPTVLKPGETITRRVVLHREDLRGANAVEVHIQLGNADYVFTLRVNG